MSGAVGGRLNLGVAARVRPLTSVGHTTFPLELFRFFVIAREPETSATPLAAAAFGAPEAANARYTSRPDGGLGLVTPSAIGSSASMTDLRERSRRTLEAAKASYDRDPSLPHTVWYGRVLGFRYRIDEAIAVFTEGLERFPDSYELLRQRGHRYLSTRRFQEGQADLARAAALIENLPEWIEPDGEGNELPVPATSIQFNTWYHLGLAHYLLREWDAAEAAYRRCLEWVGPTDYDGLTACYDWLYMTLRRKGDEAGAARLLETLPEGLADEAFVEGPSYYRRLRMYRGELQPETLLAPEIGTQQIHDLETIYATQGYGVGNWYLQNGQSELAGAVFRQILEGRSKFAFGYVAAESDLRQMASQDH